MSENWLAGRVSFGAAKGGVNHGEPCRNGRAVVFALLTLAVATMFGPRAFAAKSDGCSTAPFVSGARVDGNSNNGTIAAANLPETISITGENVEFQVDSATLRVRNFLLTGSPSAPNRLTNSPLVVFASKSPDLRGLKLTSDISIQNSGGTLNLTRAGAGITLKIQAVDCASGGVFQLEAERADDTPTDFTHVVGPMVFYFNNPRFSPPPPLPLCPAGGPFTPSCTPVPITPRVNYGSDVAPAFVGRDSAQDATKISQTGGTAVWRVLSGGRMGAVLGEDAVEVAPPPSTCTSHCQAQDQGKGKYPVLGFPSPVPVASRITPR
jgi:hypothetical protein